MKDDFILNMIIRERSVRSIPYNVSGTVIQSGNVATGISVSWALAIIMLHRHLYQEDINNKYWETYVGIII